MLFATVMMYLGFTFALVAIVVVVFKAISERKATGTSSEQDRWS